MLRKTQVCLFRILQDTPPIWKSKKMFVCACVNARVYVHERERDLFDISKHERQSVYDSTVSSSCPLTLAPQKKKRKPIYCATPRLPMEPISGYF